MLKMKRKNCLKIQELPLRAKDLDASDISSIFGGCKTEGSECGVFDYDCCDHLYCSGEEMVNTKCRYAENCDA